MTALPPLQLVWFKRDLRTIDHAPLYRAAQHGPVFPLYVVEPSLVAAPDFSSLHWQFIRTSLVELHERLSMQGQPLIVKVGEVVDILNWIHGTRPIARLWAHEETGVRLTYQRDIAVREWAAARGIPLTELPQNGVIRGLQERGDDWACRWEMRLSTPSVPEPPSLPSLPGFRSEPIPTHHELGLAPDHSTMQSAGQKAAHETLNSFLTVRGHSYHKEMSSPNSAVHACSRLSPHLAWGTIALRTVLHATRAQEAVLRALTPLERKALDGSWLTALAAFEGRLHWHCHFMQRLETEPRIEFESLTPQMDEVRVETWNQEWYERWCAGQTGYPMIDACMRSLLATGWLNFRMRAMLNSFAAYHLLLDWRRYHHFLARAWVDYEPGIHLSQCQMQAGVTGMNQLRIYNPTKQGIDQDPLGLFIRHWVPELAYVPNDYIHQPELMPVRVQQVADCVIGHHYPAPIVNHTIATKRARQITNAVKYRNDTQKMIAQVYETHGSRRRPRRARKTAPKGDCAKIRKDTQRESNERSATNGSREQYAGNES